MFTSITWQLFFTASLLIACGYYGITALLFYRHEIVQWVRSHYQKTLSAVPSPNVNPRTTVGVMGGVNLENARSPVRTSLPAEEVAIAAFEEEPETIQSPVIPEQDDLLVGSVADLLHEIKTLIRLVAESKRDKAETQSLFHALLIRYAQIENTPYQEAISLFVCNEGRDHFMFDLTVKEVITWWSSENITSK